MLKHTQYKFNLNARQPPLRMESLELGLALSYDEKSNPQL